MLEDELLQVRDELLSGDLAILVLVQLRVQLVPNAVTRGLRRAKRNSKGALSDDEALEGLCQRDSEGTQRQRACKLGVGRTGPRAAGEVRWAAGEVRTSKMVFIGIDLPKDIFLQGLEQSLV